MLKLRPEQIRRLNDAGVRNGVESQLPAIRTRLPQATADIPHRALLDLLYQRCLKARDLGLGASAA